MMNKKGTAIALVLALVLLLAGCASESVVPAVQVRMVTRAGAAEDHFAGVVVSENMVEVRRDLSRAVAELCVSVGETVEVDQVLFRYDSDELSLMLDKQKLDLDRLEADIKSKKTQVTEVEKELKTATGDIKTQLNIQLRQLQTELTQAQYDVEDQKAEIEKTQKLLNNIEVKSTVPGTVRKIDSGNEVYITIQQAGAYQVRGTLSELNLTSGIQAGAAVVVVSRVDPEQIWTGTVATVDFNNAQQNSYDELYGYTDSLTSAANYPFYVTLDSTEGLLLGQHVYIRLAGINENATSRVLLPENYLMGVRYDEKTLITSADVWTVNAEGKLTKQQVVLGEYVMEYGCYVILDGLGLEDYVADPSNPDCAEGADTDVRTSGDFEIFDQTEPAEETTLPTESGVTEPTGAADEMEDKL